MHSRPTRVAFAIAAMALARPCGAFEVPMPNEDWSLRWDNTFKYSTGVRLGERRPELAGTSPGVVNNGDRNFDKGSLISNRVDLLSEVDVAWRKFGVRLSGAAWYDRVYLTRNDNPGPQSPFPGAAPYDEFPGPVRDLHGRKAEVLDAFVYGSGNLSHDVSVSARLGRHSFQWGESLFFGSNGIAGTMAPIDVIKAISVPATQFKDLLLKVPQVSGTLTFGSSLSLGAYAQTGWVKSRLPEPGSYFSPQDYQGPGPAALEPKNKGQYGMQARLTPAGSEFDFGVYATRFHSKTPNGIYLVPQLINGMPIVIPQFYYHESSTALGASVARTIDTVTFGAEASTRRNVPLISVPGAPIFPPATAGNTEDTAAYAIGHTAHLQANITWTLPRNPVFDEGLLLAEVAWNRVLGIDRNPQSLNPMADRDAAGLQLAMTPTWRQVLPNLDLAAPVSISYVNGRSAALGPGFGVHKGGQYGLGLEGTYLAVYRFGMAYTGFYGPIGTGIFDQTLRDRQFVSVYAYTTF